MTLRVERYDARAREVEPIWRTLEQQALPPYFLSWGWVECWLEILPPALAPELSVVFDGARPVLACFWGRRRELRHGLIWSRERHLNATGVERFDELCVEHNAVLSEPGLVLGLGQFVRSLPDDWDELVLPALSAQEFPGRTLGEPLVDHEVRIERRVASPFVDLARVRASADGYLGLLAASTRSQLRRAMRGFGELRLEVADSEAGALDIYDELVRLHAASWHERGGTGAFADPWFDRFHRRLIGHRFAHGEIQLLRVSAGAKTVGCLYNLVAHGRVLFYQSGLSHFDDPRLKPGYVCHAQAIRCAADAGHAVYDFLGGDSRYKQSLATDRSELVWARIQRPLARFVIEDRLRQRRRNAKTVN